MDSQYRLSDVYFLPIGQYNEYCSSALLLIIKYVFSDVLFQERVYTFGCLSFPHEFQDRLVTFKTRVKWSFDCDDVAQTVPIHSARTSVSCSNGLYFPVKSSISFVKFICRYFIAFYVI